jgi:hypothetical protein
LFLVRPLFNTTAPMNRFFVQEETTRTRQKLALSNIIGTGNNLQIIAPAAATNAPAHYYRVRLMS